MEMDILIVCDDKYAMFAAVAITSIRENKNLNEKICIHVFVNNVTAKHKRKILDLANGNDFQIIFYDIEIGLDQLKSMGVPAFKGNYMAYGRLLFPYYIKKEIKRLLYIDCDVMVRQSLYRVFRENMEGCVIGGVQDIVAIDYCKAIGFPEGERYICSGILLIDVNLWDSGYVLRKIRELSAAGLKYAFADQDYLNLIFHGHVKILPYSYGKLNCTDGWEYKHFLISRGNYDVVRYPFYTEQEISRSVDPIIVHLLDHPWQKGCECREREEWFRYLSISGFEDEFMLFPSHLSLKGFIFRKVILKMLPKQIGLYFLCKRLHYVCAKKCIGKIYS